MYSVICLFLWLPDHYNFRAAVARVFNITADQIVCLRTERQHNIIIFTVASQEIFSKLSEFLCRILYFPILGQNSLECFAFPESPQYQLLRFSAYPNNAMADTASECLSRLGTVLYRRHLRCTLLSTSLFRTDTIGVVVVMKTETNDSAVAALDPRTRQFRSGNGQENETAARRMPNTPIAGPRLGGTSHRIAEDISAVGLQQLLLKARWLHDVETDLLQSEFNCHHQGSEIGTFQANEARLCSQNDRQHGGQCSSGNHSLSMGLSSPAKAPVKAKDASQKPSPKDEHPSSPAQVPEKEKGASHEPSPKDEHPSENHTAKDQNPKSPSGKEKLE